ncbi:hypothetical protein ACFXKR_25240 [Streptomyces violascens]|uniref:hypothetical protein n=1 Tax=Streptomyces violascens TaxID=67381 RepID=UPI00369B6F70
MRRPLVLAATAALLCAACTRVNDPEAESAVQKAVAATRQTSARVSTTLDLSDGDSTKAQIVTNGSFDMAADRGRLDVRPVPGANRGDILFADGKIYMRNVAPEEADQTWLWTDRDTAESHYVFRAPYNDPEHTLLQVSQMHEVHSKGEDTVDGVRTTRYTGVLDYETVVLRMAADVRGTLDTARDAYGRDLPFGAEAWVDGQGRLIQARLTFKDAKTTYASLTISLTDLGKPVTVTPPSSDETEPAANNRNILAG